MVHRNALDITFPRASKVKMNVFKFSRFLFCLHQQEPITPEMKLYCLLGCLESRLETHGCQPLCRSRGCEADFLAGSEHSTGCAAKRMYLSMKSNASYPPSNNLISNPSVSLDLAEAYFDCIGACPFIGQV